MTKLNEDTKNAMTAAINAVTWLDTAPADLDIPDHFIEQVMDNAECAWYDARIELGYGEPKDEDYEPDVAPRLLDLLLEDAIQASEATSGKASYADICTLAEQIAGQFTLVIVDGVNEADNTVTWVALP